MGDMAEEYKYLRELKQDRHREWFTKNHEVLSKCEFPYESKSDGEVCLFRNLAGPNVDFYPSTGRWKVTTKNRKGQSYTMHSGGAESFLKWYRKKIEQKEAQDAHTL